MIKNSNGLVIETYTAKELQQLLNLVMGFSRHYT
jgi:hypothetical protein